MSGAERPATRLGRDGEAIAAGHLERKGWRILERGFRTRTGEIDLVAAEGDLLVFVEVKTRSGLGCGRPAEAVDARKRGRILRAAQLWLARHGRAEAPCRFDVIEILAEAGAPARIHHIPDAFQAE
ncbi:MAG TPA: YraN family protein [Patescibacteria group bacterium]|nr:YraN family protein [Patescibacteria group bacterium]